MPRLLAPDDKCVGVNDSATGRRYSGTVIDTDNPGLAHSLRDHGYTVASVSGAPSRASGYRCADCGFSSFFKTCGRCGGSCERPEEPR